MGLILLKKQTMVIHSKKQRNTYIKKVLNKVRTKTGKLILLKQNKGYIFILAIFLL